MSQGFYSLKAELFSELRMRGAMMPPPPTRSANELLSEALGGNRFIENVDHPVVRDLTRGRPVR